MAAEAGRMLVALRAEIGFADYYDLGDAGDRRANTLILDRLREHRPDDAVLSEEAADDLSRLGADRVWIVDPVDGTREFSTPGRTDWAVHIALWQRTGGVAGERTGGVAGEGTGGVAGEGTGGVAGEGTGVITDAVVGLPALGEVYRSDTVSPPPPRRPGPIRIATSRNRPPTVVWWLRDVLDVELVGIGSAGAKAMAVVRGDVDAYVHAGGQWEWDSAAPAGVVMAAAMHASRLDGSPLRYNRPDPYLPDFVMCRTELAATLLDAIRSVF